MRPALLVPVLCLLGVTMVTDSKRVMVIPMPFTSHTKFNLNVARALSNLGHQVWLTIPDYILDKKVLDTRDVTVVEYRTEDPMEELAMEAFRGNYFRGEADDWLSYFYVMKSYTDRLLRNESFFRQIRAIQPQFVIIDNVPTLRVMSVIPYRLGIPFAFVGVGYEMIPQRVPFSPAISPIIFFPFTDRMTLAQKLWNSIVHLLIAMYDMTVYPDSVSRYAPEMPYMPIDMLVAKADLWLVETDHIMDYAKPSMPNVKLIGGTATGPAKPLKSPYRSFMDSAKQGVIIVSFGSYVLDLPKDISDKIFRVLMELPLKAVIRSNLPSPDPEKILTAAWIPQNDLLAHENTKVFVSHSGNSAQYEALFHAVPLVGTPIFADQVYNAERARTKGFGETVDIRTVSAEELRDTILQVAFTKRYKEAIAKASELFKIEIGVPVEKAAFWLDHVMKHGAGHMRSAGQDLPYYQFLGLDILFCYLAVLSAMLLFFFGSLYACIQCMFCRRKQKTE